MPVPVIGEPSTRTFAARCRPTTLSGAADDDWWAACSLLEEMNTVALEPGIVSRPAQKKLRGVGGSATPRQLGSICLSHRQCWMQSHAKATAQF